MSIDPQELEDLLERSGVGKKTKKKIIDTNATRPEGAPTRQAATGHGSAVMPKVASI